MHHLYYFTAWLRVAIAFSFAVLVIPAYSAIAISPPHFSQEAGFYPYTFKLRLHHQDAGVSIFYTLDGSLPNTQFPYKRSYNYKTSYRRSPKSADGSMVEDVLITYPYRGPIKLGRVMSGPARYARISTGYEDKAVLHLGTALTDDQGTAEIVRIWGEFSEYSKETLKNSLSTRAVIPMVHPRAPDGHLDRAIVVRAVAVGPRGERSSVVTHTYFFGNPVRYKLPIVSLVVDPEDIFGYEKGVMVAGARFDAWRVRTPRFTATAGTADANWRDEGDSSERPVHIEYFEHPINASKTNVPAQTAGLRVHGAFSRADPQKSLRLHGRKRYGNDEINVFGPMSRGFLPKQVILRNAGNDRMGSMFRDSMTQSIIDGLRTDISRSQSILVFLNGEYWGHYMLRERLSADHFSQIASIDDSNIEVSQNFGVSKMHSSMATEWVELIQELEILRGKNEGILSSAEAKIDIASFIDSHISHIYAGNNDWPYNNMIAWRVKLASSARERDHPFKKWQWPVIDLDMTFLSPEMKKMTEMISDLGPKQRSDLAWSTHLFRLLMSDPIFRQRFVQRYFDLLNTYFMPDRVLRIIDQFHERIAPEMPFHIHRWQAPTSMDHWEASVEQLRNFSRVRADHQRGELQSLFDLGALLTVEILPLGPDLALWINGLRYEGNLTQSVRLKYFKGAQLAIKVENIACRRFLGWKDRTPHKDVLEIQVNSHMVLSPQLAGVCPRVSVPTAVVTD